jgi:hypothetical protein
MKNWLLLFSLNLEYVLAQPILSLIPKTFSLIFIQSTNFFMNNRMMRKNEAKINLKQ